MNNKKFSLGFSTLDKEITIDALPIVGTLPEWLSGTLVRNGPAKFEVGQKKIRHWFDGFSMLHAFSFAHGKVSYANKFLESKAYKYARDKGKIGYVEFATDPCRSIFNRFVQMHLPFWFSPKPTDNANVNISKIADKFVALTETPLPVEFDPKTLETYGVFTYDDTLDSSFAFSFASAHPHTDFQKNETISYFSHLSLKSSYKIFRLPNGSLKRELIATIPVKKPAYIHSFGMTKNYVVLAEYPFSVNLLNLLWRGSPFSRYLRFIVCIKF